MNREKKPLISVIMSTYNESCSELYESIFSVINQSFEDFEFIIINDNPLNSNLRTVLTKIKDDRIFVYENEKNSGLVYSLNRAIKIAKGKYIARMDADDICFPDRLTKQVEFIEKNNLDLIGSYVSMIDEEGASITEKFRFPVNHRNISKYMKFGSCIAHPTWLGKREMFLSLNGYRNIDYCEDYDFILRAINKGYKTGNLPEVSLKYRIRKTSVSNSNHIDQYLCKEYLSKNRKKITNISEENIAAYLESDEYRKLKRKMTDYQQKKKELRNPVSNIAKKIFIIFSMLFDRFFGKNILEKISLIWRKLLKIQ